MNNNRLKFRAWYRKDEEYLDPKYYEEFAITPNGVIHVGLTVYNGICDEIQSIPPSQLIVEQCTGLKDKTGKLIYEGDVIKVVDGCVHLGKKFEVVGCMIRWEMRDLSNDEYDTLMVGCCVEIIGNIHDDQFRGLTKKVATATKGTEE